MAVLFFKPSERVTKQAGNDRPCFRCVLLRKCVTTECTVNHCVSCFGRENIVLMAPSARFTSMRNLSGSAQNAVPYRTKSCSLPFLFHDDTHGRQGESGTMGIDDNETDLTTTGSPIPLFKLTPGMTASSHGIACAEVAGEDGRRLLSLTPDLPKRVYCTKRTKHTSAVRLIVRSSSFCKLRVIFRSRVPRRGMTCMKDNRSLTPMGGNQ